MDKEIVKVTVVTVCRNAQDCIKSTIESVLEQKTNSYEYLIIDGASEDSTSDIAKEYADKFKELGIRYFVLSEPDSGIYNAMNKSLNFANGEWIIYLNAGDTFCGENSLNEFLGYDSSGKDVVYGDVLLLENKHYKKAYVGSIEELTDRSPICHQGVFVRTKLMREYKFDESYHLAADYDFLLRLYKLGYTFEKTNLTVAVFLLGGESSKQSIRYLKEMCKSREKNHLKDSQSVRIKEMRLKFYNIIRFLGRTVLRPIFYSEIRGWYSDKYKAAENDIK